ncbi:GNAT family N-acetyltransferase [Corynebacterium sp.]|uniref:GNAT family N-acetyltransferase n=1 Tax=Corynebacterium sp. TaxID=1720 RepID=UPI002A91B113|nr:GNAT family N-acetyltransferase [Corynebacterium sp.]MDY5786099.1 GNAT family N-acetyltransferase [Corynebacterium sp.]
MTVSIRRITGHEFAYLAPTLVCLYIDAMGYSPTLHAQRVDVWRREIAWPGFSAVIAVDERDSGAEIIGVAYGFLGSRGRWWDRQLVRGLREAGGPTHVQEDMLSSYFEIAEVHVTPTAQGGGIGRAMLTELVRGCPARWALLSTPEVAGEANAAFGLYRKLGFADVLRGFYYSGDKRPFAVLGRRLPLETAG